MSFKAVTLCDLGARRNPEAGRTVDNRTTST